MAHSIEAEEEAVMRASTLANQVNCPLLLKGITSDTAADIVKVKKNRGNVLYADVTPAALGQAHHMFWRFLNSRNIIFVRPIFPFWFLVTFGDEVT